jgi:hypothetical protein
MIKNMPNILSRVGGKFVLELPNSKQEHENTVDPTQCSNVTGRTRPLESS